MDSRSRKTVCKRKLDETKEELERVTRVQAKRRKEKETDADILAYEMKRDKDKINQIKEEIETPIMMTLKLERSDPPVWLSQNSFCHNQVGIAFTELIISKFS